MNEREDYQTHLAIQDDTFGFKQGDLHCNVDCVSARAAKGGAQVLRQTKTIS